MPYGIGYVAGRGVGWGRGGGYGFGFRGASPPWPYIGRGRGGLPRCGYYFDYPPSFAPTYPNAAPAAVDYDLGDLKSTIASLKRKLAKMRSTIEEMEQRGA